MSDLKAPFPWFGGKSRVADIVWERFGNVPNYVEPFFGSGAVLLGRPHWPNTETVNDLDCYLANFWRAIQADPLTTAEWADWPVNEADLLARHQWLVDQSEFKAQMRRDPEYCDFRIAGWWVWGICQWIGSGWCVQRGNGHQPEQLPHLGSAGMGINRKLPHLGDAGMGINRKLPHLGDAGMGINRKLPHLGNAGRGEAIAEYFTALSSRLRNVRVACGEWNRILSPAVTYGHGVTGVFLDPPYIDGNMQYSAGGCGTALSAVVREWAIANGENQDLRIALCGYEGEHVMPDDWDCVKWKAFGGYGVTDEAVANASRERIWFSPACLRIQEVLF